MQHRVRRPAALGAALVAVVVLAAGATAPASATGRDPFVPRRMPDAAVTGCDVLLDAPAGHHCLLPWPNDAFTLPAATPTGRRLNISSQVDPANVQGVHVDTTAQNKSDGFSPGSAIMTYVPGLSIENSHIATSTNIGLSLARNAPIVILDTATHQRVPYFAELDAQTSDPSKQLLLDPPGRRVDRRAPLRGRAAQPGRRQWFAHRTAPVDDGRARGPAPARDARRAHQVGHHARSPASAPGHDPLPGVGLHGGERARASPARRSRCARWRTNGSRPITSCRARTRRPTSHRRTRSRRSPTPTAYATSTGRSRSRCSSPTPARSRAW